MSIVLGLLPSDDLQNEQGQREVRARNAEEKEPRRRQYPWNGK